MKYNFLSYRLFAVLLVGLSFSACSDEELPAKPNPTKPTTTRSIKFSSTALSVSELGQAIAIDLSLDNSAAKDGTVTIDVNAQDENSFTTSPAVSNKQLIVPVATGQKTISFQFTPVDDNLHKGNQAVQFTISEVSEGLTIANEKNLGVTVLENDVPVRIGFNSTESFFNESHTEGYFLAVLLSITSPAKGDIEVSLGSSASLYGTYFTTEPAAVNGKITLTVVEGTTHVPIKLIPTNNNTLNGHKEIDFTITNVSSYLQKGDILNHRLVLKDDELVGKAKGYSVGASGGWSIKRTYEYDEQGRVSKILWQQATPGVMGGEYVFTYNDAGQVIQKTESLYEKTMYLWENGRIVKSEKYRDGVLQNYATYGYDAAGNVGEMVVYYRQPNGELKMGSLFVYLYFDNGNIYKQLSYSPIENSSDYALNSTRTYDNYLVQENPFTMVDILPTVDTQINLPGTYREEAGGFDLLYQLTYEFDANGKPTMRTATSGSTREVAYYEYY